LKIIGIIPARGGSKGIPQKNIKLLNGKPLISYTIDAAKKSKFIDHVFVSTDDTQISEISKQYGAEIPCLRPKELAADDTLTLPVIQHMTRYVEENIDKTDIIITLQPTSPLRTAQDIDNAIQKLIDTDADSVSSVFEVETHPYLTATVDVDRINWLYSEEKRGRRQDFPHIYALNGAIYATKREVLLEGNSLYGKDNRAYIMPQERSIDIDNIYDFIQIESILKKGNKNIH
jgi:CMP-N,N'-diacetyllegionaminic acid synthase